MSKLFNQIYKALSSAIAWIISIACSYLIIQFVALVLILVTSVVSLFAFFPILAGIGIYLTTGIWQLGIIIASIVLLPLSLLNAYKLSVILTEICKKHSSKLQGIKQKAEQKAAEITETYEQEAAEELEQEAEEIYKLDIEQETTEIKEE